MATGRAAGSRSGRNRRDSSLPPAFRHDPAKALLRIEDVPFAPVRWSKEPAVCDFRTLSFTPGNAAGEIPVPICSTPAVLVDLGVIVASYDGHVRLFDRKLERLIWERRLSGGIYASLVFDLSRRTVIAATINGIVACMTLRGAILWRADIGAPVHATPTVVAASDLLIVAAFNSLCKGLNLETGEIVFTTRLQEPWHAAYGSAIAHRDPYATPVALPNGDIVLCCAEEALCLGPDGAVRWRCPIGHSIRASPVALHAWKEIAICSVDGSCTFVDQVDGVVRTSIAIGGKLLASPAVSDGILVVGTTDDCVVALDVQTKTVVWKRTGGAPRDHSSFSTMPDGSFVSTGMRGNVVGLRREDGAFLWETNQQLGLAGVAPAVDITPIVVEDGSMYCGSYSGVLFHYKFDGA